MEGADGTANREAPGIPDVGETGILVVVVVVAVGGELMKDRQVDWLSEADWLQVAMIQPERRRVWPTNTAVLNSIMAPYSR